jgi:hypothetical protein
MDLSCKAVFGGCTNSQSFSYGIRVWLYLLTWNGLAGTRLVL